MQLLGSQQEFKQIADNTYAGFSVISKSSLDLYTKALSLTFFFFPFCHLLPIQMLEDSICGFEYIENWQKFQEY